ncbi:MAG: ribonuclease P protein component [Alphaproteobacteria bacterium]|nr:ribonuclease P protein component [Alphaproteobacteria bacterium]
MLKRRCEFVRLNKDAAKIFRPGFVLQVLPMPKSEAITRIGFTVTKRIGNAATRNRARRRLRALWRAMLHDQHLGQRLQGYDFVLIARTETPTLPYRSLLESLRHSLRHGMSKVDRRG